VVARHTENHDQRHFNTTFNDFHGRAPVDNAAKTIQGIQAEFSKQAGANPRPQEKQKVKTTSCLTGEFYSHDVESRTLRDPQENTDVQRSWLYAKDAAVIAVQGDSKRAGIPEKDNELSLPLGQGEWAEINKAGKPAHYRHQRTDVTTIKNKPITRK
jgi:hypothetical protein